MALQLCISLQLCNTCREDKGYSMPKIMHPLAACSTHGAHGSPDMEEPTHPPAALQPLWGG